MTEHYDTRHGGRVQRRATERQSRTMRIEAAMHYQTMLGGHTRRGMAMRQDMTVRSGMTSPDHTKRLYSTEPSMAA